MDVGLGGGKERIEAAPDVLHEVPDAKVLMLSMQDDPRYVREAFAAGASGYVLKEAADSELVTAVRQVAGGTRYVDPTLGARMAAADADAERAAEHATLSDREREVLRLLALGHTNQQIAKSSSSPYAQPRRTARTSCKSCASAPVLNSVRYAISQGLLDE